MSRYLGSIGGIPIYKKGKIAADLVDGVPTAFIVSHKLVGTWQIIDTNTGCVWTPQAYEAYFGELPPPPPSATKKTRKEWYAHRKKNPASESGKGFGVQK